MPNCLGWMIGCCDYFLILPVPTINPSNNHSGLSGGAMKSQVEHLEKHKHLTPKWGEESNGALFPVSKCVQCNAVSKRRVTYQLALHRIISDSTSFSLNKISVDRIRYLSHSCKSTISGLTVPGSNEAPEVLRGQGSGHSHTTAAPHLCHLLGAEFFVEGEGVGCRQKKWGMPQKLASSMRRV